MEIQAQKPHGNCWCSSIPSVCIQVHRFHSYRHSHCKLHSFPHISHIWNSNPHSKTKRTLLGTTNTRTHSHRQHILLQCRQHTGTNCSGKNLCDSFCILRSRSSDTFCSWLCRRSRNSCHPTEPDRKDKLCMLRSSCMKWQHCMSDHSECTRLHRKCIVLDLRHIVCREFYKQHNTCHSQVGIQFDRLNKFLQHKSCTFKDTFYTQKLLHLSWWLRTHHCIFNRTKYQLGCRWCILTDIWCTCSQFGGKRTPTCKCRKWSHRNIWDSQRCKVYKFLGSHSGKCQFCRWCIYQHHARCTWHSQSDIVWGLCHRGRNRRLWMHKPRDWMSGKWHKEDCIGHKHRYMSKSQKSGKWTFSQSW